MLSTFLADFTCDCFAILDFVEAEFEKKETLEEKQQHLPHIGSKQN